MRTPPLAVACACLLLGAWGDGETPRHPAPKTSQDLTGILERVRQDVGNYELQAARWRGDITPKLPDSAIPADPAFKLVCTKTAMNYDYDIVKIELAVQVLTQTSLTGDAGLKLPIGGVTIGPNGKGSRVNGETETVVLDRTVPYDPDELRAFRDSADYANLTTAHRRFEQFKDAPETAKPSAPVFPITNAMLALRRSLVAAAGKYPCFDVSTREPGADTIKLDFEVDAALDGNLGFDFAIVSAHAGGAEEHKLGNTITVTFAPHDKTRVHHVVTQRVEHLASR